MLFRNTMGSLCVIGNWKRGLKREMINWTPINLFMTGLEKMHFYVALIFLLHRLRPQYTYIMGCKNKLKLATMHRL